MDDVHRKPKDDERDQVAARIRRAAAEGRISEPDRDIRLGNVGSAQSMWELDLMTRELDQLDAMASPVPRDRPPATDPGPSYQPVSLPAGAPPRTPASKRTGARGVLVALVVFVLALGALGAVLVVGFRTIQGLTQDAVKEATERSGDQPAAPDASGADSGPAGARYALTTAGIREFLQAYRKEFRTNRVVDLTLYGDYAVVNVPRAKSRQEGWVFREASGFTSFGGVRATFPGARPLATSRLAIPALVRNIARARSTLRVEDPSQTYVVVRFIPGADKAPTVNIYVANEFSESGYLATTLAGQVQRAFPFRRQ